MKIQNDFNMVLPCKLLFVKSLDSGHLAKISVSVYFNSSVFFSIKWYS